MRDCPLVSMATGSRRWGARVRVLDDIVAAVTLTAKRACCRSVATAKQQSWLSRRTWSALVFSQRVDTPQFMTRMFRPPAVSESIDT